MDVFGDRPAICRRGQGVRQSRKLLLHSNTGPVQGASTSWWAVVRAQQTVISVGN